MFTEFDSFLYVDTSVVFSERTSQTDQGEQASHSRTVTTHTARASANISEAPAGRDYLKFRFSRYFLPCPLMSPRKFRGRKIRI